MFRLVRYLSCLRLWCYLSYSGWWCYLLCSGWWCYLSYSGWWYLLSWYVNDVIFFHAQVDRIIPVANREQMTQFSHLFAERTRKNLADGHLWFSVVARPPQSRFTRVQRVSCCLCLLFVSMLANAMFYNKDSTSTSSNQNGVTIGPFSLSPEQVEFGQDPWQIWLFASIFPDCNLI